MRVRPGRWASALAALLVSALLVPIGHATPPGTSTRRFTVDGLHGVEQAVALWTPPASPDGTLPIVIAFHGLGESRLGRARGYDAWVERYGLRQAYEALFRGWMTPAAFGALIGERELSSFNAELSRRPLAGVLVVGVYTPNLLRASEAEVARYARWVAHELVPQIRTAFPFASCVPRQVGLDGVSLGGMVALAVGLRFPEVFGAVGAIQPAIGGRERELAALAAQAKQPQRLRVLSSDDDPLLPAAHSFSQALRQRRIGHELVVYPGAHGYAFNRGPAAIELLHFQDRALRALPGS